VQDGDVYVVCSDGLSNMVSDQEIGAIASELPPAEACPFLVALANLRGGLDNITVVVVRVGGIKTAEGPAPTTRRKPGFLHIHWPFSALLAGILLAAVAAGMTALGVKSSGLLAFYLSAAALMVGLGGLMLDHYREKRRPHDPAPPPPLRVYRDAVCKIDRPMVDKLAKAKIALEDWAREKKWEVDWDTQKHHHDLAEGFANQGNLAAAFREYCRAMRPLNETLQQQRQKAEVFQPLWDKKPKNENRDRK
jgi:protein phosphatase